MFRLQTEPLKTTCTSSRMRGVFALLSLLSMPHLSPSQTIEKTSTPFVFDPAQHVISRNSSIAVGLNRYNGQFWVETNTALPILFSRANGITSFTNIRFEGVTFTNNDLHNPQTPPFTERMPYGTATALTDRAVFKTTLSVTDKHLECTQEFIPSIESDYAFIRIKTTLKNTSTNPVKAGLQLMYDLFIGETDMFDVVVGGRSIMNEEGWKGTSVPDTFEGAVPIHPVRIRGRLTAPGLQTPDRFIVGYWRYNGYLGAAAWNYEASGLRLYDVATLEQWDEQTIQPGSEWTITTDYGYIAESDASMRCFAEEVRLTQNQRGYTPNPLTVGTTVTNTGSLAIPAFDVEIQLPPKTTFAAGETAVKSSAGALLPGDSVTFLWKVSLSSFDSVTLLHFPIQIIQPARLQRNCLASVLVPAIQLGDPCIQSDLSTRGIDFWTAFPTNTGGLSSVRMTLFLAASGDSKVRVARPALGTFDDMFVPAGTVQSFVVESMYNQGADEILQNLGIHITSDVPISVYAGSMCLEHSEATLVLPTYALGTSYVTVGYNTPDPEEYFLIVGTEPNTMVTISPAGQTSMGKQAHVSFQGQINTGQTYSLHAGIAGTADGMTGSIIEADKPIAVLSGGSSGWIPVTARTPYGYNNPHFDQVIPDHLLGTEYVAVPFRTRLRGDTYKAVATADSTSVVIGVNPPVPLLRRGAAYEFILNEASRITADKPILLAQFANSAGWDRVDTLSQYGDAAMVVLTPTDRYLYCQEFPSGLDEAFNQVLEVHPGQSIEVPDNPSIAIPVFTAECWVQASSRIVIVSRDRPGNALPDWSMVYLHPQHRIEFMTGKDSQPDEYYWTPMNSLNSGQWNHVALVVNGPQGTVKVYINGSLSLDTTFAPRPFTVNTGLAWNGYFNGPSSAGGNGFLDECRYWNYERTEQQIRANMNTRLAMSDRAGLVGYWSFCDNTKDSSAVANVTTVRGNPQIIYDGSLPGTLSCSPPRFANSFVNLVVHDGGQAQVVIDGAAVPDTIFHPVKNSSYLCAQLPVTRRGHIIESSDHRGISAIVYGFDERDAYAFNAGFLANAPHPITGLEGVPGPEMIVLGEAYPNPCQADAAIPFSLPGSMYVRIVASDMFGTNRAILVDGYQEAGRHVVPFPGNTLPAGMYLFTMTVGGQSFTRKVLVVK